MTYAETDISFLIFYYYASSRTVIARNEKISYFIHYILVYGCFSPKCSILSKIACLNDPWRSAELTVRVLSYRINF